MQSRFGFWRKLSDEQVVHSTNEAVARDTVEITITNDPSFPSLTQQMRVVQGETYYHDNDDTLPMLLTILNAKERR